MCVHFLPLSDKYYYVFLKCVNKDIIIDHQWIMNKWTNRYYTELCTWSTIYLWTYRYVHYWSLCRSAIYLWTYRYVHYWSLCWSAQMFSPNVETWWNNSSNCKIILKKNHSLIMGLAGSTSARNMKFVYPPPPKWVQILLTPQEISKTRW